MKISKLFHWLYAFIMLMPVFFIAGRVAYVTFNKNAKDSYSGSTELTYYDKVYEQTNEIINDFDIIEGNYYKVNFYNSTYDLYLNGNFSDGEYLNFLDVRLLRFDSWDFDETILSGSHADYNSSLYMDMDVSIFKIFYSLIDEYYSAFSLEFSDNDYFIAKINEFVIDDLDNDWYSNFFEECPQEYLPFYYEEKQLVTSDLDNAFEYSVNQLNEVPIFSWAQTSFLVAPFSYITGLFGIASTSPVNTLLSYWLSISIIWLVFDLVMYLPLLIHRWLDKGVLE